MSGIPRLVGMVHLPPLPGAPGHAGMAAVLASALEDAARLTEAGFPALMIENYGDTPFYPREVPAETVAGMAAVVQAVARDTELVLGINVLRNDADAALAVATATGASFVRVNVLSGTMYTDQGPIVGDAAAVMRKRAAICPDVEVWADVMVKHATPPPGADLGRMAADLVQRARSDAVIVSGAGTGSAPHLARISTVRDAVGDLARVVIGSGATVDNLVELLGVADSVIVGSSLKHEGDASNPVDPARAVAFVAAATQAGLV